MDLQKEEWKNSDTIVRQVFLGLLPAQILSSMTSSLGSLINGLIIGNFLPAIAMVVLGFSGPVTVFFGAIATIFAGGARVLSGRYIGRNDRRSIDGLYTSVMIAAAIVGLILSAILYFNSWRLTILLGARNLAARRTAQYLRALSFGVVPTVIVPTLMVFLQMVGFANYALYSALVLAGSNIVFSLGSVYLLNGGVFGIGCAISLSQWAAMFFLLARFGKDDVGIRFRLKQTSLRMTWDALRLGSPAALALLLYSLRNVFINKTAMLFGGEDAVQAVGVVNSVIGIFDAVNVGVGAAALIMASVYVGEKDAGALQRLMRCVVRQGGILALLKLLIIAVFGNYIGRLFGAAGNALYESYRLLVFQAINMPLNILLMALVSPYQALGRIKFVNIMYLFSAFGVPVACCYLVGGLIGTTGVWICYLVAEVTTLLGISVFCAIKNHRWPVRAADYLWLDENFDNGEQILLSLTDMKQVLTVSESLVDFCRENGVDARRSKLCGLCMEEMAGNVVLHGFTKKKRGQPVIDLLASCEDDGSVILRLRDNCPPFDPATRLGELDPEDPCKGVGIRMVLKLAEEVDYQSSFGMNVLTIRL